MFVTSGLDHNRIWKFRNSLEFREANAAARQQKLVGQKAIYLILIHNFTVVSDSC